MKWWIWNGLILPISGVAYQVSLLPTGKAWVWLHVPNFFPKLFWKYLPKLGWEPCLLFKFLIPKDGNRIFVFQFPVPKVKEMDFSYPFPIQKFWKYAWPFPIPNPKWEKAFPLMPDFIPSYQWRNILTPPIMPINQSIVFFSILPLHYKDRETVKRQQEKNYLTIFWRHLYLLVQDIKVLQIAHIWRVICKTVDTTI